MPLLNNQEVLHPISSTNSASPSGNKASLTANQKSNIKQKARRDAERALLREFITSCGKPVTPEVKAVLDRWANPGTGRTASTTPWINKIFGPAPKVGDSITLLQVWERFHEGTKLMADLCRGWRKKAVADVEYQINEQDARQSKYVIKTIGA